MKYYIKKSDTCGCKYIQTHDNSLESGDYNPLAWGSAETYTNPQGDVYTTTKCDIHKDVPIGELNDVLLNKECRARNLAVKSLIESSKLSHLKPEDLMGRFVFKGEGSERTMEVDLPELTTEEKEEEVRKLDKSISDKLNAK